MTTKAKVTSTRTIAGDCPQIKAYKITAVFKLEDLGQGPYFSATIEKYRQYNNNRWGEDSFGADHDAIRQYFPKYAKYLKWHLVNWDNGPMHYIANALYWAGKTKWTATNAEHFKHTVIFGVLPDEDGDFSDEDLAKCTPEDIKETLEARLPDVMKEFYKDMRELFGNQLA